MQQGNPRNLKQKLAGLSSLVVLLLIACVESPEQTVPAVEVAPVTATGTPVSVTPMDESAGPDLGVTPAAEVGLVGPAPAAIAAPVPGRERKISGAPLSGSPLPEQQLSEQQLPEPQHLAKVAGLCEQIGNKLGSVSVEDCMDQGFVFGGGFSVNQRPLVFKERPPQQGSDDDFRVLIMGGIHGDEYSSISIMFKWLALFSPTGLEGEFHWRFAPLVNPDGLLDGDQARRQNANGVDLNRNFPSQDWSDSAATYWQESTGSNPRRFPGRTAASEPEVQWVVNQIEEFQPDVIVSVHAPFHLLDFDGPAEAPDKIGELYLHQLGIYPGSLGNFAGLNRKIPVVTLELPSAGIMPPPEQINLMWRDLVAWLDREGRKGMASSCASIITASIC